MSDTHDKNSSKKSTYFITGGGTGGHIYPAVAVLEELKKDSATKEIYYVGNPDNLEFDVAKKMGYNFLSVKISGMPRKMGLGVIKWVFELSAAVVKTIFYILKYKPDAIFGTGGYVSAPALFAGKLTNTSFMIHDCDAKPGIVSRVIAPMAKHVSVSFECAKKQLKNKNISLNGNPIRTEFKTLTKQEARKDLGLQDVTTICIMGGSQGAKSINNATVGILKTLLDNYNTQIVFQTGKKNYEKALENLKECFPDFEKNERLIIKPYFDNMVTPLKACDIAVSRAGSLSLSELCACSIASILIPYPHAAADHQRKNAKFMVEKRAALYLEDADTTKDTLLIAIEQLLDNPEKLEKIQNNAGKLAKLDATASIVEQLKNIVVK